MIHCMSNNQSVWPYIQVLERERGGGREGQKEGEKERRRERGRKGGRGGEKEGEKEGKKRRQVTSLYLPM